MTAKLCLGTVQFGMHYGIHNTLGRRPTEEEVFGVLDAALDTGICMFDTASAYGTSEEMLGRYGLSGRGGQIISKLHPAVEGERRDVQGEIQRSLTRLFASRLYCYMLHRVEDLDDVSVMDAMEDAKARGWTDKIGVSIYSPEDAMRAAEDSRIDVIQVPYNVLDQRLDGCGFFECAKGNQKEVFARSAFYRVFCSCLLRMQRQRLREVVSMWSAFNPWRQRTDFSRVRRRCSTHYVMRRFPTSCSVWIRVRS